MADVTQRVSGIFPDAHKSTTTPGWGTSLAGFFVAFGLVAAFLAVGFGLPGHLPLQAASWLTFLAVVIAPGYLLGDIVTWRLDLDLLERLALSMPLGVAVMALPGMVAMLGHLTLQDLAVAWTLTTGALIVAWFVHRLLLRRNAPRAFSQPWQWADFVMLLLLIAAFVYMWPALSLYKMDGDAYAVATFTADALTGRPLNLTEPVLGTGRNMGSIRMGMNQLLPVFHLWSYFSQVDHIELLGTASRSMLALWGILASYMLGKAAGGSRRVGFLTASIQVLVYLAAPFFRADHVGIFFFERTNADKFTVTLTMLPVVAALAIRYVRAGRSKLGFTRDTWIAAALAGFAVSSIHALIAAMLALALAAFGGLHLLLNVRRRDAWIRIAGLTALTVVVMILPLVQLFEARKGEALAPSYPSSFEGWSLEERPIPVLPAVLSSRFPSLFPFYQMQGLDVYGPLPDLANLEAQQANTSTNPFLIWRFALNMRRQRIIVFDLEHYISDPTLILEPPYLLAFLLLPFLLWRLRSDPGAQFCLSTTLAVLFVMFNPILTPILGSMVMPWILWRFVWLLPYALILALVVDRLLAGAVWLLTRLPGLRSGRALLLATGSLSFIILTAFLLRYSIVANVEEIYARGAAPLVYATPEKIISRLSQETAGSEPVMVLADSNLSVTIPAFVGNADVVAHRILSTAEMFPADQQDVALQRHIDQYDFLNTPLLTPEHVEILRRYDVHYLVVPTGASLDAQMLLSPGWFERLVTDHGYSLYAVRELPTVSESLLGNAAFVERRWEAAADHYQSALKQEPATSSPEMLAVLGTADIHRIDGEFDQVLAILEKALDQIETPSPGPGEAVSPLHFRLGQTYADMGEVESSIREFDLAQRGDPANAPYHMALGDACLIVGRHECAQEQFETAAELIQMTGTTSSSQEAQRLTTLASIWQQRAYDGDALALYEKAAAVEPTGGMRLALADAYRRAQQYGEAEELLKRLAVESALSFDLSAYTRLISSMARLRADQGKVDQAVALYRQVIRMQELLVQDTRATRLILAQALLDAGAEEAERLDEARTEIDQVLSLDPHSAAAYVLLGNLYRAQYEPDMAMAAYQYALRLDPTEAAAYTSLSDQYRQQSSSPDDALALMQRAVEFNPEQAILALALADQFRRLGNVDMAIMTYQQALGWFGSGSEVMSRGLLPTGRTRALAYSRLAGLYEDLGRVDTAMNYYRAAVAAAPDQPWTRVTLGDALRRRNQSAAAETVYRAAIQADPTQVDPYLQLAGLLSDLGDVAAASELYDQALRVAQEGSSSAQTSRAWLALGTFLIQSPGGLLAYGSDEEPIPGTQGGLPGEGGATSAVTDRALAAYVQGLETEESVAGVRVLARLYQDLGQTEDAVQLYEQRIQLGEQERWVPSLLARYHVGLGDVYLDGDQIDQAIGSFRRAVALDGWWPGARLALARGYSAQGGYGAALGEIRQAADLAPGSVEAQLALAATHEELGDRDQSLAIYLAAVESHPGSVLANLALARAWQDRNRWELAEQSYRQAIAMVPGDTQAYLGLADINVRRALYDEAEDLLRASLAVDRSNVAAYLALGDLLRRQARHVEALQAYDQVERWSPDNSGEALRRALVGTAGIQQALGELEEAESTLWQAAAVAETVAGGAQVELVGPLLQLAELYQGQNQPAKAEQMLLLALEGAQPAAEVDDLTSGDAAQTRLRARQALAALYQALARGDEALMVSGLAVTEYPDSTLALVGHANQLRLQGFSKEADETFQQAQELAEPSGQAYRTLAAARQVQGQVEEALAILDQAVAIDPEDAANWIQIGVLQTQLGAPESALAPLERATTLAPANGRAWSALGEALLAADRTSEARLAFEHAIAVEPMYLPAYAALAGAYEEIGQREQMAAIIGLAQAAVPGSPLGYLYYARMLEEQEQWEEARQAWQEVMARAPGLTEAYIALGQLDLRQGNVEGAMDWYRQAIDLWPGDRVGYLNLIDLFLARGKHSEALALAQTAVQKRPGDGDLWLRLGRAQRIQARYADAESSLLRASGLDQSSNSIMAELALVYETQGQLEKAIAAYDQALVLSPDQTAYYLALARLWSARGRPEHALSLLRDALPTVSRPVPLYVAMSDLHLRRGEPRLAREILEQGIATFGEDSQLLQALGAYYQSQADFKLAEETYQRAALLPTEETSADADQQHLAIGGFYLGRGRAVEALAEYEQAVVSSASASDAQQARAQLALGNAYRLLRRPEEAVGAYAQAVRLAPSSEDGYIGMASVFRSQGDWEEAKQAILEGLAVLPSSGRLLMEFSSLQLQRGDDEDSLRLLDRAVQVSTRARTYVTRAALYRVLGRPEDAQSDLEAARQIEPGSTEALVALGSLYRSQGKVAEAKEMYRRALSLEPGVAAPYIELAELALDQGQFDEAWWQFAAAREAEPASVAPLVGLAAARARQQEWEDAETAYHQATELAPASTAAYLGLADVAQRRSGSVEDAISLLEQVESPGIDRSAVYRTIAAICRDAPATAGCDPAVAEDALQQAVQLEPSAPEGYLALADLFLAEGRPREAERYAVLALEVAPRDLAVRVVQGDVYHVLGDLSTAEGSYQEAISLDATRLDGYTSLAQFHVAQESYPAAVAVYEEAIQRFPLDWTLWVSLGNVYVTMEEYAAALAAFEQAAEMNPSATGPLLGQGDVHMAQKKWDAAQKAYEQAQRLRPNEAEPLLRLASLSEERDSPDKAMKYARKAIEVEPASAASYVTLGRILQEGDKASDAADAFLSAIKRDPRQRAVYNRWMWCYTDVSRQPYSVDRSRLKAELAKLAESDDVDTVWAQTLLGMGYLTLEEEMDQAIEHLNRAIEMDPVFADLYQEVALAYEENRDGPRALESWARYLYAVRRTSDTSEAEKHIENLNLVRIEEPSDGEEVSGSVKIVGTAKGKFVESYKLEYRAAGTEDWSAIATGSSRVKNSVLATWDTSGLPPGEYELQLDVVRSDGDYRPYDQIRVVVRAAN